MIALFSIISLITQLLPLISQTIHIVEVLFPQSGMGAQKAQTVIDIVSQAAGATGAVKDDVEALAKVLTPVISNIVALKNATGVFSKGVDTMPVQVDAPDLKG